MRDRSEANIDAMEILKGLNPIIKDCPAEEGRKEMWFPRFSDEGIIPPQPPSADRLNVIYACGFSGDYTCRWCMRTGNKNYQKPQKT